MKIVLFLLVFTNVVHAETARETCNRFSTQSASGKITYLSKEAKDACAPLDKADAALTIARQQKQEFEERQANKASIANILNKRQQEIDHDAREFKELHP